MSLYVILKYTPRQFQGRASRRPFTRVVVFLSDIAADAKDFLCLLAKPFADIRRDIHDARLAYSKKRFNDKIIRSFLRRYPASPSSINILQRAAHSFTYHIARLEALHQTPHVSREFLMKELLPKTAEGTPFLSSLPALASNPLAIGATAIGATVGMFAVCKTCRVKTNRFCETLFHGTSAIGKQTRSDFALIARVIARIATAAVPKTSRHIQPRFRYIPFEETIVLFSNIFFKWIPVFTGMTNNRTSKNVSRFPSNSNNSAHLPTHPRRKKTPFWKKNYALEFVILAIIAGTVGVFMSIYADTSSNRSNMPIAYQGRLMDASYIPKSDSTYYLAFEIYSASSGGTCKWRTETTQDGSCAGIDLTALSATTSRGLFTVVLGNGDANNPSFGFNFDSTASYLQIYVCPNATPGTTGSCETLTPRKQLGGVTYSYNADLLDGLNYSAFGVLAGQSGGQTLIGGTAATDDLTFRTTSGVGASGADMIFQTGNNGATEAMRILYDGSVGIGTTGPDSKLTSVNLQSGNSYGSGLVAFDSAYNGSAGNFYYSIDSADLTANKNYYGIYSVVRVDGTTAPGSGHALYAGRFDASNGYGGGVNAYALRTEGDVHLMSGNVGIGTSTTDAQLVVSTDSGSTHVNVKRNSQTTGEVGVNLYGGTGGSNWGIYIPQSSNDLRFYNTSDLMTITSAGSVGIGTAAPTQTLQATATVGSPATTGTTQNGIVRIGNSGTGVTNVLDIGRYADSPYGMWMQSGDASNLSLTSVPIVLNPNGGGVGIGTTGPSGKFDVKTATNHHVVIQDDSTGSQIEGANDGASTWAPLYIDGTTLLLNTHSAGNVGIGTAGPSGILEIASPSTSDSQFYITNGKTGSTANLNDIIFQQKNSAGTQTIFGLMRIEPTDITASSEDGDIYFQTMVAGTRAARMTINGGNVGIGTTTPNVGGFNSNYRVLTIKAPTAGYAGIIELQSPSYASTSGEMGLISFFNSTNENARITARPATNAIDDSYLAFHTRKTGGSLTEQVRIDQNGYVGIGTTSPGYPLEIKAVKSTGNAIVAIKNTTGGSEATLEFDAAWPNGTQATSGQIRMLHTGNSNGSSRMDFVPIDSTGNWNTRMSIQGDGNVGIGTTTPGNVLDISGGGLRVMGATAAASSGAGGEISYSGGTVYYQAYNRASSVYLPVSLAGSTVNLQIGGNNKVTVDANGNVGIGGNTPSAWTTNYNAVQLGSTGAGAFMTNNSGGTANLFEVTGNLYFDGTNYKYVNTGYATHIIVNNGSGVIAFGSAGSGTAGNTATVTNYLTIANNGTITVGSLSGEGNRLVYSDFSGALTNSSSDVRLKKNIVTLSEEKDVLSALKQLRGVYYNWDTSIDAAKNLGTQREIGMIAQEVELVLPELVGTNSTGYKSLDYPKLVAFLVETGKAQQAMLDPLAKGIAIDKKYAGSAFLTIDRDGHIGIGTDKPTATLDIKERGMVDDGIGKELFGLSSAVIHGDAPNYNIFQGKAMTDRFMATKTINQLSVQPNNLYSIEAKIIERSNENGHGGTFTLKGTFKTDEHNPPIITQVSSSLDVLFRDTEKSAPSFNISTAGSIKISVTGDENETTIWHSTMFVTSLGN